MRGKREFLARMLAPLIEGPMPRLLLRPHLTCLTYHRIGTPDDFDDHLLSASLDELDWQARWLRKHAQVLDGRQVQAVIEGRTRLDRPAVCVTFDDGYADNLAAARILHDAGLSAIFFVTTGFVGTTQVPDWDRLAYAAKRSTSSTWRIAALAGHGPWELSHGQNWRRTYEALKKIYRGLPTATQPELLRAIEEAAGVAAPSDEVAPLFMSWDQVRQLGELGHTVGAHTHTHPILASVSPERQREEMASSKRLIEERLGTEVSLFAYPVGKTNTFTHETQAIARQVGFAAAFSFYGGGNRPGSIACYDVKRVSVTPAESRDLFRARVMLPAVFA